MDLLGAFPFWRKSRLEERHRLLKVAAGRAAHDYETDKELIAF
jgi:hypothetical protein